jgi:hypothetical protein
MSVHSEAVKRWRKHTKNKLIAGFGGVCGCCGYDKCPAVFELHHLDPNLKDFGFGGLRADIRAWDVLAAEAAKCVMLCANCHREVHAGIRELPSDILRFDQARIPESLPKPVSLCPICSGEKHAINRYCSARCSGLALRRVDWSNFDLHQLLVVERKSYTHVAGIVGVSGAAVAKHAKKLGLTSYFSHNNL